MLGSPEFQARAAATRVLCYWRDRVSDALARLKKLAADEHPRVRLEAVRAASFFDVAEAVEVVAIAGSQPGDETIDFVRGETLRTLDPIWKKALAENRPIAMTTDAGKRYLLDHIATEALVKMRAHAGCLPANVGAARRAGRSAGRRRAAAGRKRARSRRWPS